MPKTIKNMGIDISKALETGHRKRGNKFPSLRRDNWTEQAKKDFEFYRNCTVKQFERLGK